MNAWNRDACRPRPFYFLNTDREEDLGPDAARAAMTGLRDAGYGGCVLFNKPPTGFSREAYLGEAWFRALRAFAEAALPLGLEIWINDGFDFPPGDAGGRISALAPHLGQQRLTLGPGGQVTVLDVPWGHPAFEEPESSRLFIDLVYEPHRRHLGDLFGRGIAGFFSDADNRRVPHGTLTETYFPWSRQFAAEFERAFGYPVGPHLPAILGGIPGQPAVDYWRLAGRLYQRWFANNHDWCRRHGLKYAFHTSDTGPFAAAEMVRSSIFTEGDAHDLLAHADFPGTDHELRTLNGGTPYLPGTRWFREQARWGQPADCRSPAFASVHGDVRAKLASSAAFLFGREGALCECFAATNWSAETDDWRRIAVWQIMQGITFLVPHAVHHRFFGPTKYFAPPEFLRCGALADSLRQLNDHLADLCAIASLGRLLAPVALLDPTEEIWRTGATCPRFFDLAVELNRRPQGYVIASPEAVLGQAARFRVAIDPGENLPRSTRERLAAAGVTLLEASQLDRLDDLVPVESSYSGTGRPHFLRRAVDGGELLLVANVEDEVELRGEVRHAGRACPVALVPGEVAIFAPGWQHCRAPRRIAASLRLDRTAAVGWAAPNVVTLFRWENPAGEVLDRAAAARGGQLCFRWRNDEEVPPLRLLTPAGLASAVFLDGCHLPPGVARRLHDEECLEYAMPGAGSPGEHLLQLACDSCDWTSPCFLEGDFECTVAASGGEVPGIAYYNFALMLPQRADVSLRRRRSELDMARSWAEQGHPFYSGTAVYRFDLAIPPGFRHPVLRCGAVHCRAALTLDGIPAASLAFPPWEFDLRGFSGTCRAELAVECTLGNRLDGYGAPAGLAAVPELLDAADPP